MGGMRCPTICPLGVFPQVAVWSMDGLWGSLSALEPQRALPPCPSPVQAVIDDLLAAQLQGRPGRVLNNDAYRLHLREPDSAPFAHLGKPGHEAETRELLRLAGESDGALTQPDANRRARHLAVPRPARACGWC
jgi:hypothetical protein